MQCKFEIWGLIAKQAIIEKDLWGIQLLNQSTENIRLDEIEYWDIVDLKWIRLPAFDRFLIDAENNCKRPTNYIAHGHKVEFICAAKPNVGENYKIRITYRFDLDSSRKEKILLIRAS